MVAQGIPGPTTQETLHDYLRGGLSPLHVHLFTGSGWTVRLAPAARTDPLLWWVAWATPGLIRFSKEALSVHEVRQILVAHKVDVRALYLSDTEFAPSGRRTPVGP